MKLVVVGCVLAVCGCASQVQPPGQSARTSTSSAAGPQAQTASVRQSSQLDPQQQSLIALADRAGGPAGGWLIGANPKMLSPGHEDAAKRANQQAEQRPAQMDHARKSDTADLNNDGFITLDEVLALKQGGLSDHEIISRLRATGDVFALNDRQMQYLADRGISARVIGAMAGPGVNVAARTAVIVPPNEQP
ncbi:MAG TPA: hypothetical protein VN541_04195 [Tepidisphaeraceae bacterium]|nr:hypothetical protein [Tepidisphaeraceae bacterium]